MTEEPYGVHVATPNGRRHVQCKTPGHLSNGGPMVVRNEAPPSCRRNCRELGGRSASVGAARRDGWPHQRRHLAPEDHLIGPFVYNGDAPPQLCGNSKARASSNPPGSFHVASALNAEVPSRWLAPESSHQHVPIRRSLEA